MGRVFIGEGSRTRIWWESDFGFQRNNRAYEARISKMLVPPADSDSAPAYITFMLWRLFLITELEKFNFHGVTLFFQTTTWIEAKCSLVNRPMGLRMRMGTGVHIPPRLPFYELFLSQLDNTSNPLTRI